MRLALAPLARIAAARSCAVLAILHINKSIGSDWYRRLSGSGGFGGAARSVLLFGRDPDDPDPDRGPGRILAHAKCNVGPLAPSQRWTVAPILLPASGVDPETHTARLELLGESEHGARALLDARSDPQERLPRDEAEEFLRVELANGPRPAKDMERAAREAGIARMTLRRARTDLGVTTEKSGFHDGWEWALHEGAHPPVNTFAGAPQGTPSQEPHEQRDCAPSDTPETPEGSHPYEMSTFAAPGYDGFLEALYGAFEREQITEGEWYQLSGLHRTLAERRA